MSSEVISLSFDTYQTLGKRTYWIYLSKWLETPFVFLIIAFGFSIARRTSLVPLQFNKMVALGSVVCFGIFVITFIICFFMGRYAYRNQGFCIASDALKIRQGVITKQEIAIPYHQIQNVDIERTFSQQLLGVSKLVIVTAGHDDVATPQNESKGILDMVDKEVAVLLQEELLRRADIQKVITVQK